MHFSTGHLPSEKMWHKRPLVARGYPGECEGPWIYVNGDAVGVVYLDVIECAFD